MYIMDVGERELDASVSRLSVAGTGSFATALANRAYMLVKTWNFSRNLIGGSDRSSASEFQVNLKHIRSNGDLCSFLNILSLSWSGTLDVTVLILFRLWGDNLVLTKGISSSWALELGF